MLAQSLRDFGLVFGWLLGVFFSIGGTGLLIFRMPGNRNADRETEVKILVRLAVARGIARISENAGRTRMEQLVESLRSRAG